MELNNIPEQQESIHKNQCPSNHKESPNSQSQQFERSTISKKSSSTNENESRKAKANEIFFGHSQKFPEVSFISSSEILSTFDIESGKVKHMECNMPENIIMIDCRSPEEQALSIIQNSMTRIEFEKLYFDSEGNKKKETSIQSLNNTLLVPYCTVGFRSGKYCQQLKSYGFKNVMNSDGILLWLHAGGKVVTQDPNNKNQVSDIVHTNGPKTNLAPIEYKTQDISFFDRIKAFF